MLSLLRPPPGEKMDITVPNFRPVASPAGSGALRYDYSTLEALTNAIPDCLVNHYITTASEPRGSVRCSSYITRIDARPCLPVAFS